jgi:hypothetical protein
LYPEDGVGEENAKIILMTAILVLFFPERIPAMPFVYLYGIGASMKSSLAQKVGKLLHGHRFKVRGATDDERLPLPQRLLRSKISHREIVN